MKKVVNSTGLNRLIGFAEKNGVTMTALLGIPPIFSKGPTIRATVDENGITHCAKVETEYEYTELDVKLDKIKKNTMVGGIICVILAFISTLVLTMYEGWAYQITLNVVYLALAVLTNPLAFGIFFSRLLGDKEIVSFCKYNAAKNAAINAYNDTDKVPNSEEIREYSWHEWESPFVRGGQFITVLLGFSILRFLPMVLYIISALALVIIVFMSNMKPLSRFWQFLVVSQPDDVHYNAAIQALHDATEFYDNLHFSLDDFILVAGEGFVVKVKFAESDGSEEEDLSKEREGSEEPVEEAIAENSEEVSDADESGAAPETESEKVADEKTGETSEEEEGTK